MSLEKFALIRASKTIPKPTQQQLSTQFGIGRTLGEGSSFTLSNRLQTLRNDQIPFISLIFPLIDC